MVRLVVVFDAIGANDTSRDHGHNDSESKNDHAKGDILHDATAVTGEDRFSPTIWLRVETDTIANIARKVVCINGSLSGSVSVAPISR